jgi:type II secretory pathway pseudopilin PulG
MFYQSLNQNRLTASESKPWHGSKCTQPVDRKPRLRQAFTLLELLSVLACVFFLAVLILPAFAGTTGTKSKALQCLQNQRQIMAAMLMYTHDNNDFFPPNPDDGNTLPGHNWCPGQAGIGGANEYDPTPLIRNCVLMPYLNTNATLFRCTADERYRFSATDPRIRKPAVRSISMNQAVGTVCATFRASGSGHGANQPPIYAVNGPWLNNTHTHMRNQPYRTYGKTSEMVVPSPAGLWVLLEESQDSLNDASFAFGMRSEEWIDFPSTLHEFGCVFSFGDGHTELRKWTDSRTEPVQPVRTPALGSSDWRWMADHTSARAL